MLKSTIARLYSFIAKLITLLEEELDELNLGKIRNSSGAKKNIADTLNRLVVLIIQLNKLSKEDTGNEKNAMPAEDQEIIARFIEKYINHNK